MRMGYNTNGAIGFPLEDTIRLLSDLGFQSIALTLDHEVLNPFSADIGQSLERTQRLLTRLGMHSVVETGARYLLNRQVKHHPTLVSPDPAEQQFRILFLKRAVEIASRLESDCVSLWSGPIPVDGLENRDQIWDRFCDRLSEVLDYAQRLDVPLGFEPEPGMLVATVADFLHLQKRLPHPMLRLTLDIGHVVCQAEGSVPDIVAQVAGDLVKICNGTERFWARVVSVIGEEHPGGSRIIHAIVDNELLCNDYYDLGDAIQFRGWHVYSIEHKHESNDNAVAAVTSAVAVAAAAGAAAAAAGAKAALAAVIVPAAAAPPTEDAALAAAFAAYNREPADTE